MYEEKTFSSDYEMVTWLNSHNIKPEHVINISKVDDWICFIWVEPSDSSQNSKQKDVKTTKYGLLDYEYHVVDGCKKKFPIQCHTCEGFLYLDGTRQLCRKHKGNGWNGYESVCAGHVCDDWKWCGF